MVRWMAYSTRSAVTRMTANYTRPGRFLNQLCRPALIVQENSVGTAVTPTNRKIEIARWLKMK